MKILVTGGRGFVGGRIAARLMSDGHLVRLLLRDPAEGPPGFDIARGDLSRPATLRGAAAGVDAVVHSAALMSDQEHRPWADFLLHNAEGTRALLDECRTSGAPFFLHVSTTIVTGPTGASPASEEAPLAPGPSRYSRSKALAETAVAASGLPHAILRLPPLYGPGMRYGWPQALGLIRAGRFRVLGEGRGLSHLTSIDDAVDGVISALNRGRSLPRRLYHLAGPEPIAMGEAFDLLARVLGRPSPPRIPFSAALAAAYALQAVPAGLKPGPLRLLLPHRVRYFSENYVYNTSRAAFDFGFSPSIRPAEGLAAMAAGWASTAP